MTAYYIKN